MLTTPLSQTEKALRDTIVNKAAGEWLDRLSNMHGIPYPKGVSEDDWRGVLKACAIAPRGTPGVTFEFLRNVLNAYTTEVAVTVGPSVPLRLTAVSGTPFTQDHIGTYVRVLVEGEDTASIYYISGPPDITTSGGAWVVLDAYGTAQWAPADFSYLSGSTNATAEIMPFLIDEPGPGPDDPVPTSPGLKNWLVIVRLLAAVTGGVPPTYLQDDASARPVGEPFGGHLQEDEFEQGSQVTGPYPLYLTGTTFGGISTAFDLLLAAGAHSEWKEPLVG